MVNQPSPSPFERIQPFDIPSQVVERIIHALDSGYYAPGDRLPAERQLANQLGISRSSLREAITTLAALGVLEVRPGSGTFVRAQSVSTELATKAAELLITGGSPLDALEARLLFEPALGSVAAERAEDTDLKDMRLALREMEKQASANEPFGYSDTAFHLAIARATRNPFVEHVAKLLLDAWIGQNGPWNDVILRVVTEQGRLNRYLKHHHDIYDAITQGEAERASEAIQDHLLSVRQDFLQYSTWDGRGPGAAP